MARPRLMGMQVISPGTEPISADVVFIHGLQGDAVETWSFKPPSPDLRSRFRKLNPFQSHSRSRSEEARQPPPDLETSPQSTSRGKIFWPGDFLASDVPDVRLLTFGYSSDVLSTFRAGSQNNIMQHAQNLVGDLLGERNEINRPIIFVCHSLGGIIVKEALRLSVGAKYQPRKQRLYQETYGVIFLGTPHRGSPWAPWAKLATNLAKLALQSPSTTLLDALQVDSSVLQIIADEFSKMIREDLKVHSFREEKGMSGLYGLDAKVVDDFSSIIGDAAEGQEGIDANHTQMCKFPSRDDAGYKRVLRAIRDFVTDAATGTPARTQKGAVREALGKLDASLRQRLELDLLYSNLRVSDPSKDLILDIPVLRGPAFEVTTDDILVPPTEPRAFGSCAFELAGILKLLPGQSRSSLLTTEPTSIQKLICDKDTYYGKSSRHGLFQFITQHFVSLRESSGHIIIQTDLGIFTLIQTDRRLLVRVNSEGKAPSSAVLAPQDQDYFALRQCAAGKWCLREGDQTIWETLQFLIPGTARKWAGPIDIDSLLHMQFIEHHNCIYFLDTAAFKELQFRMQCAIDLQDALEELYEQKSEAFPSMKMSFKIFAVMNQKRLIDKDDLSTHVGVVKLMIADAMALGNPQAEGESPTQESSSNADIPTEGASGASKEGSSEEGEAERSKQAVVFLGRCHRFHGTLLQAYRATSTRRTLLDLLTSTLEQDPKVVNGQVALSLLYRGNAQFILHRAVSVSQAWLDMLTAAEGDVYVG